MRKINDEKYLRQKLKFERGYMETDGMKMLAKNNPLSSFYIACVLFLVTGYFFYFFAYLCSTPQWGCEVMVWAMSTVKGLDSAARVGAINDDPNNPCLKSPTCFSMLWDDAGSGNTSDYSFSQPICSDPDYIAPGSIFVTGIDTNGQTPNPANYPNLKMVRSDLVTYVPCVPPLIWDDAGSHARSNASLFALPKSNYFICSTGPGSLFQGATRYPSLLD
ncbi:hypothetical protein ACVBEF_14790 [Glaciimonas sp. GG7]